MRTTSFAVALIAMSLPALAEDYPYPGVFTIDYTPGVLTDEDQLSCMFNFVVLDGTGTGVDYTLDRAEWAANKRISYVPADRFACTFDAASGAEDCRFSDIAYTDGFENIYSVVLHADPDRTTFGVYLDKKERLGFLVKAASEREKMPPAYAYQRCDRLTPQILAPYLATDAGTMTPEDVTAAMLDPLEGDDAAKARDTALEILTQLAP